VYINFWVYFLVKKNKEITRKRKRKSQQQYCQKWTNKHHYASLRWW